MATPELPFDVFGYIVDSSMLDCRSIARLCCCSRVFRDGLEGWADRGMLALPYSYDKCMALTMPNRALYLDFLVDRRCRCCGSSRSNIVWQFDARWCRDCFGANTTTCAVDAFDIREYISYDLYDNGVYSVLRFYRKKKQ